MELITSVIAFTDDTCVKQICIVCEKIIKKKFGFSVFVRAAMQFILPYKPKKITDQVFSIATMFKMFYFYDSIYST